MAKSYLFAVQDENGREICSWKGEVDKVGDLAVERKGTSVSMAVTAGDDMMKQVAAGEAPESFELFLHRWPADDKLSEPTSKPVK